MRDLATPLRLTIGALLALSASVLVRVTGGDRVGDGAVVPPDWAFRPLRSWESERSIDDWLEAALEDAGLVAAEPAARRDLVRRLTVDLHGLLPTLDEIAEFESDLEPDAHEKLIDRLLASPRYGERQARHWMDLVHYAETHGHDEDGIRENAWPYRDYLIASRNDDTPHDRFVREQIAGDVLFPDDPASTVATAFLAVGPWDQSSQAGIQDGTIDKLVAQYMDRDDMITTTLSTFASVSVHCARCHDHKFDPISQNDYFALQAVFAGVDRVDRPVEVDAATRRRRRALLERKDRLDRGEVRDEERASPRLLARARRWIHQLRSGQGDWRVLDAERVTTASGASFERRSDGSILFGEPRAERDTYTIAAPIGGRLTGLRLEVLTDESLPQSGPGRADNGNLHLSELRAFVEPGEGSAPRREVKLVDPRADFDQSGWTIAHALDSNPATAWGIFPRTGEGHTAVVRFAEHVDAKEGDRLVVVLEQAHGGAHLIGRPRLSVTTSEPPPLPGPPLPAEIRRLIRDPDRDESANTDTWLLAFLRVETRELLASLPAERLVYAATTEFEPRGNFRPARGPRPVHLLRQGDVRQPGEPAVPGALSTIDAVPGRFADTAEDEGARRVALADWLVHRDNPLSWRSIANRLWARHFRRGIAATPNELGSLGARPSHPELLDRLAARFRDEGGSWKRLERQLLATRAYRQSTVNASSETLDPRNELLGRYPLRRLDAETVRDSLLAICGELDLTMGGPSVRQFHATKGVHVTPVVDYIGFRADRVELRRRSVYRFVFRTLPDPYFAALDCPDASKLAPTRSESVTVAQALALRHHPHVVHASRQLASSLRSNGERLESRVERLFERVLLRSPDRGELALVVRYARQHGLANAARWLFNLDEFLFLR